MPQHVSVMPSFLLLNIISHRIYLILSIHSPADEHIGYFKPWAIINNVAMNIYEHPCAYFVWTYVFKSFAYIPGSGISGSYGIFMFNHLRNSQTVFQSGCNLLHFHQQCMRVPVSPQPYIRLLLSVIYFSRSSERNMAFCCDFNLHFPNE